MWPARVSNAGPLIYKSGALPTALCGAIKSLAENVISIGLYIQTLSRNVDKIWENTLQKFMISITLLEEVFLLKL